jgi:predicted AAA+ superfamily ATPase
MPHPRKRAILEVLEKRLKLFPVVGLLGARQTGKSTALRDQLSQVRKLKYITLDREENRTQATEQPTLFIQQAESANIKTLCIDEIQKAPGLFDTIKAEVDEQKRPGRFMISGSTEFSKKTGIQESLTGRIALLRLFPLNLQEIHPDKKEFSLKDVKLWADRGGMPGFFAIRDEAARLSVVEQWIETTCSRDLANFKISRFNPELARRILFEIAISEKPNRLEIARSLAKTPRQIEAYLQAFKALFVIYEIEPDPSSVGKPLFYIFDSGIAQNLGASSHRCLQIWFLNQCYSTHSYAGKIRPDIFHYETSRGSTIDFIVKIKTESTAYQIYQKEAPTTYDLRALHAFHEKHKNIQVIALAPCLSEHKVDKKITILPWGKLDF